MLKTARDAIIRGVTRIAIHEQQYLQVLYSPSDDQDTTLQTRVGVESAYPDVSEGDRVIIHMMMNVVTKIVPSGDQG
jgi:hypothetical protein